MEVGTRSYYVNPNTRTLTTNLKNTQVYDEEGAAALASLLGPVDNMGEVLKTPLNLADRTTVSRRSNSANLALGTSIRVAGGFTLTVKELGVEVSGVTDWNNYEESQEANAMAGALGTLLRNAGGTMHEVGFSSEERAAWTENVSKVLQYIGIDPSKDFTVNGMNYTKDADGNFVSKAKQDAVAAYEQLKEANQTYTFADERTKKAIAHMSQYYLGTAAKGVADAWQETLEETGINPFPEGYSGALQQLAMEQDFRTGGNDKLFGETVESSKKATEAILDRIDHPIGTTTADDSQFLNSQREFYSAFLAKLQKF